MKRVWASLKNSSGVPIVIYVLSVAKDPEAQKPDERSHPV